MRGTKAKRLRREQKGLEKPKQFNNPILLDYQGKSVYIPRAQRRKLMQKFKTDLKKGRIDPNVLAERIKNGDWN